MRLGTEATAADLAAYDEVVVATGVVGRVPDLAGVDHPKVVSYADVLSGAVVPGRRVAVIGAGGIGVDVSHFLTHDPGATDAATTGWRTGASATRPCTPAASPSASRGRRSARSPCCSARPRRSAPASARRPGWAHRAVLKQSGVVQVNGVTYDRVDDAGLHVTVDGEPRVYDVDHVVLCAGQESVRGVYDDLVAAGRAVDPHLIGGADVAAELDAKRAIEQGTRVAAGL